MGWLSTVQGKSPSLIWLLNESSGTTAADSSGNSKTGTYTGGYTLSQTGPGTGNGATAVNGTTGYIVSASSPVGNITTSTDTTIECWCKFTALTADMVIAGLTSNSSTNPLFWIKTNGLSPKGVYVQYRNDAGTLSGGTGTASGGNCNDGNWHQVVTTLKGSTGAMKMYVDGAQVGSTVTATVGTTTLTRFAVGAGVRTSVANYFTGTVACAAVYASELTSSSILANYNAMTSSSVSLALLASVIEAA